MPQEHHSGSATLRDVLSENAILRQLAATADHPSDAQEGLADISGPFAPALSGSACWQNQQLTSVAAKGGRQAHRDLPVCLCQWLHCVVWADKHGGTLPL